MVDLNEVLTFSEAAEKWGFTDGNTLRKAVERKKFRKDEIRKSGNIWLTTYPAMIRVFGTPSNVEFMISYADIILIATDCIRNKKDFHKESKAIYENALAKMREGIFVAVVESQNHPNVIARILSSEEELKTWFQFFEYRLKNC